SLRVSLCVFGGSTVTLVGVLEPSFTGPMDTVPAFWIPFASYAAIYKDRPLDRTSTTPVSVIARVAHGVSRAAAAGELSAIGVAVPSVPVPVDPSGAAPGVGRGVSGGSW